MTSEPRITAHSLLHAFLELRALASDFAEWTEEGFESNPPRLVRLRRLRAMFRAFGLAWNPRSLVDGTFLLPLSSRHEPILERLPVAALPGWPMREIARSQLPTYYALLFDYRTKVERVLTHPARIETGVGILGHALAMMIAASEELRARIGTIDDTLAELISPEATEFTLEELQRDFGYPDVDLDAVDGDWF